MHEVEQALVKRPGPWWFHSKRVAVHLGCLQLLEGVEAAPQPVSLQLSAAGIMFEHMCTNRCTLSPSAHTACSNEQGKVCESTKLDRHVDLMTAINGLGVAT
ncbi:hypothetical protein COO60DRAFT_1565058, partial [Scenedesmus sp. NREL 46B-D3]